MDDKDCPNTDFSISKRQFYFFKQNMPKLDEIRARRSTDESVRTKVTVLWDAVPRSLVKVCCRFRGSKAPLKRRYISRRLHGATSHKISSCLSPWERDLSFYVSQKPASRIGVAKLCLRRQATVVNLFGVDWRRPGNEYNKIIIIIIISSPWLIQPFWGTLQGIHWNNIEMIN
jgi:hypothetical protein